MTHPPNSYHYQPATDFESQESEHMYQQSHPIHMSQPYEGGQRGLQQGATGHQRRNNSLIAQTLPPPHHHHHAGSNGMLYYYDWKNFPVTQAPGSFIPSPEEANMHGQGPMSASAMGAMAPYHPFASSNSQFMPPPPPPQQPSSTSSSSSSSTSSSSAPSTMPQSSAAYGGMVMDTALSAPSMNASNFMPGPSPNFNNSMSYNFIPALPPPAGEQYFSNHHRTAGGMDARSNGSIGEPHSYSAMYPLPPSMHFSNAMHSSRLASPPVPGFPSHMDGDYYAPSLPYHPMMMGHASSLHYQHASRSASPSVAYSTSASPSPSHYSQGPPSSFACHPFSRPSLPPGNTSMSSNSGPRLACRPCIRGHRAPSCKHVDRPLFAIRPRGRPSSQCVHCKEARKTGGIHVKCLCGNTSPSSKSSIMAYGSSTSPDMHKSGGMVSAEPSLKIDSVYTSSSSSSPPPQQHSFGSNSSSSSKMAANKSALAAVMQSFWSGINSSENPPHNQESDSASESASRETNLHRRTLSVEATDTVSQKPPEPVQPVDSHMSERETEHELEPVHSQCICSLGMPCLCSSKSEKLPKQAEPASITSSLHQRQPHNDSSQSQQRVLHSNQPMDHNSYEYHRLNVFHEAAAAQQEHSGLDQQEEDDEDEALSL